jgi:hypothetical protein
MVRCCSYPIAVASSGSRETLLPTLRHGTGKDLSEPLTEHGTNREFAPLVFSTHC